MEIIKNQDGAKLNISLKGRLDTSTAPQLAEALGDLAGIKTIMFDFKELEYVSSAGLRVLLATQKTMNGQGEMALVGVNDSIMEVFEMTGFLDIFHVIK